MLWNSNIIENSSLQAALFALCLVALVTGCNQRRYKPSTWRQAAQNTMPSTDVDENAGSRTVWSSLPSPFGQTLPFRSGSTLPNRGGMWTLPNRGGSTLPLRDGMNTLPQFPGRSWSTLPGRGGPASKGPTGRMNTLPARYPEYDQVPRNWNTLPARQPLRGGAPLGGPGWNTLPQR